MQSPPATDANAPDTPDTSAPPDTLTARLRLKRHFLLSLVISLTACALVAIGALLLASFNKTTMRILGTLIALAFHSGIAMYCAAALERARLPALAITALALFALNFVVLLVTIWWPGLDDEYIVSAILTTLTLVPAFILAIPCTALAYTRRWFPLPQVGLLSCVIASSMTLICAWLLDEVDIPFAKATWIAAVIALSFAHHAAIGQVPAIPALAWLLRLAVASLWALAVVITVLILGEGDSDFALRIAGAVGVLDAAATLALVIMTKVKQVGKIEGLQSTDAHIEIRCPRCQTAQTVEAGNSTCQDCGLKFHIEIQEPRCGTCGYLLWQLPERRCPECGTPF